MIEAEKSFERQVAYSKILDAIRRMSGKRTPIRILAEINQIATKDDAWKQLEPFRTTAERIGG